MSTQNVNTHVHKYITYYNDFSTDLFSSLFPIVSLSKLIVYGKIQHTSSYQVHSWNLQNSFNTIFLSCYVTQTLCNGKYSHAK